MHPEHCCCLKFEVLHEVDFTVVVVLEAYTLCCPAPCGDWNMVNGWVGVCMRGYVDQWRHGRVDTIIHQPTTPAWGPSTMLANGQGWRPQSVLMACRNGCDSRPMMYLGQKWSPAQRVRT
uniref:Uncharacterized protein n=1 Tax=Eutreptiella gymnastica TaxID=73025 RepID=A0A7S4G4P3_9EUGL